MTFSLCIHCVHCRESTDTGPVVRKFIRVTGAAFSGITRPIFVVICFFVVIAFILDVELHLLVYAPAGVTQEEGHTGFPILLPSAVLPLIFISRRIQPSLSLVDREVEFCVPTK